MITAALPFTVRDASDRDGPHLLELMRGETTADGVRWSMTPGPDPFAALKAERGGWAVALAEDELGRVLGFISVAARMVFAGGQPTRSCYVTNLKVLPGHRGRGIGDALCWHAIGLCKRVAGNVAPILMVVRSGNSTMRGRVAGPRGLPKLAKVAEVEVHSVAVRRAAAVRSESHLDVRPARPEDLEEMAALATSLGSERDFGPWFDAKALERWIDGAPGLSLGDHLVARSAGRVVGWVGWWDEVALREARIAGYTMRGAVRRAIQSATARLLNGAGPASVGERIGCIRAVHAIVPKSRPNVLRALIADGARRHAHDCSWLKIALDTRDPLVRALDGLRSQVAAFDARLTTPTGGGDLPPLHDVPLHLDAALL